MTPTAWSSGAIAMNVSPSGTGNATRQKAINEIVQTYDGVYFDQLQALFTHVTGMYTSL